jgi:carboxyl-terminal processing protease
MRHRRQLILGFGLMAAMFFGGFLMAKGLESALSAENETYSDLKIFAEVVSLIQKNYVEELNAKDIIYGAIRGMLSTLDPHSAFMPPDVYKEVQVDTKGEFGGLGIQIGMKDGKLTVIAPIDGTPADRAGIKAGDIIVTIDGETTKNMTMTDAVQKMRGPKGTQVNLSIQREGKGETIDLTLIREVIKIESVKHRLLEAGIGYIRISQFQEQTGKDLSNAIRKLQAEKIRSLILDLRNNPGGLLTSAVETTEQFLPSGKLIVYIKGRDGKKDEYISGGKGTLDNLPMIVLVNEGSASASEIVSGALQDWGRAVILGDETFGKGSVQTILPLSDGSGLRLTTAKYYTPNGRSIQNTGITPDILVKIARQEQAPTLREKDLEGHLKNEGQEQTTTRFSLPPAQPQAENEDIQLNRAVELLKSWNIFKDIKPLQTAAP